MSEGHMKEGIYVMEGRASAVLSKLRPASCWGVCYVEFVFPRNFGYQVQDLPRTRSAVETFPNAENFVLRNRGSSWAAWPWASQCHLCVSVFSSIKYRK